MDIGYRNLCRRNQIVCPVLNPEELFLELGKLAGRGHARLVHHERRQHFQITVLRGVKVEHEVNQGALESCAHAFVKSETSAGDLGGPVKIDNVQVFGQVPVRLGLERELRRLTALRRPPPDLLVVVLVLAVGHRGMRQVRNSEQDVPLGFFNLAGAVLKRGDLIALRTHLRYLVLCGLPGLLEPADLLGDLIAPAAEGLDLLLRCAPFGIQRKELRQVNRDAPSGQRGLDRIRVLPDKPQIKHLR